MYFYFEKSYIGLNIGANNSGAVYRARTLHFSYRICYEIFSMKRLMGRETSVFLHIPHTLIPVKFCFIFIHPDENTLHTHMANHFAMRSLPWLVHVHSAIYNVSPKVICLSPYVYVKVVKSSNSLSQCLQLGNILMEMSEKVTWQLTKTI